MYRNTLYLDTARLGLMSAKACNASIDLARFATEHACTLYFSQLLQEGFSSWPSALQRQYQGLSKWEGVFPLKENLRRLAEASRDSEVLLASRGASLMKFASRLLTGPCRNVLITDTCWPAYKKILLREFRQSYTTFSEIPIRRKILRESISTSALIDYLVREFLRNQCDGLFIPLVDNLGIRLPVEAIVRRIRQQAELRFVVVDGAQAIGHVPLRLQANYCDFLLAGSHKWLRAFFTMGIGFFGNPSSRDYISDSLRRWSHAGIVDDPLLAFSDELASGVERSFGETVQIAPLLVANAATQEALRKKTPSRADQELNRQAVAKTAGHAGWKRVAPNPAMASQILLFENPNWFREWSSVNDLRRGLATGGVAATVYQNGLLRFSLPVEPPNCLDWDRLTSALAPASSGNRSDVFSR